MNVLLHKENSEEQTSQETSESRSVAERISFALALFILLGLIGGVGYLWVSDHNQNPPILQVSNESSQQRDSTYYVPFSVINTGGKTAEMVQVIAELRVDGEIVEWGEQTVNFLSRREEVTGSFVFLQDPAAAGELTVRIASYSDP